MEMQEHGVARSPLAYFWIFLIVLTIFALGANRAWVQHRIIDGEYWVYRVQNTVQYPFMWQYDLDAKMEFEAAQNFPNHYRGDPYLISRPFLQMSVNFIGRGLRVLLNPILLSDTLRQWLVDRSLISSSAPSYDNILFTLYILVGFIVFKILLFFLSGVMAYEIMLNYFRSSNNALLGVVLLFLTGYSIRGISVFHTYEFEILTPVVITFLFIDICKSYSLRKNILYSLIVGLLMLAKANYATYLTVLVFCVVVGGLQWQIVFGIIVSVLVHLLPWAWWQLYLELKGMPIIGILGEMTEAAKVRDSKILALHPADIIGRLLIDRDLVSNVSTVGAADQPGVDMVKKLSNDAGLLILQVPKHFFDSVRSLAGDLGLWGLFSVYGIGVFRSRAKKAVVTFILVFLMCTWVQAFVAFPFGPKGRTLLDPVFVFYGFASLAIFHIVSVYRTNTRRIIYSSILVYQLLSATLPEFTPPFIHPLEQIGIERKH